MHLTIKANVRKTVYGLGLAGFILFLFFCINNSSRASAGPNNFLLNQKVVLQDETTLNGTIINGPPIPPPGYGLQRKAVVLPLSNPAAGTASLTVPAYQWSFGCSATSGSMIAGYYDRNGFPNMYTGPTNAGAMPLDSSVWPNWVDGAGATYAQNPLDATRNGLDGRSTRGSMDDYWVAYNSSAQDPYITNSWAQHTWGDGIGDYMKTSQSASGNVDGSTAFYNFTNSATPLTCSSMVSYGIDQKDGTYGRKLFYESRGYTVTDCYNQGTDNIASGGFSFAQYKAEIDAGRPVMLNLAGHTIVGVGYDNATNTVYLHDTWDYSTHTMTWGGSYSGMQLQSVSIVNLASSGVPTNTATPSLTPTKTLTPTITLTRTNTPTRTLTPTTTRTSSPTSTLTRTSTYTLTFTPTLTTTSTNTASNTPTRTLTSTITNTPTSTVTASLTKTPTITQTPSATLVNPVTVTVRDTDGIPISGLRVYAYSGGVVVGSYKITNTNGQVVFSGLTGSYRFEAQRNSTNFWSDTSDSCTVPGCTSASVTVTKPLTVTVLDTDGVAQSGLKVYAFSGGVVVGGSKVTDVNGQVVFSPPIGSYRFDAQSNGGNFWSSTSDNCTVPGCTSASVTVTKPLTVTVLDTGGIAQPGLSVSAYSGITAVGSAKTTDVNGQAVFTLPAGGYTFRVTKSGLYYWSGMCIIPGSTSTTVTVSP